MSYFNMIPDLDLESGLKPLFSDEYILAFYNKFCDVIKSQTWKIKRGKNARYVAEDFLKVFFFSEITGRSMDHASEALNRFYLRKKRGKRKKFADGRKRREIPHQTDVNKFLKKIGLEKARRLLRECLDYQLQECLKLNIISNQVNVLVDFTEHGYYGKRNDKMIKGTNRLKGTKKMRHYLGFSLLSKRTHVFGGLEHVAKGQSKTPLIAQFLDHLVTVGLKAGYTIFDREFYDARLIQQIKERKINVITPVKTYKKIKRFVKEYLEGKGNRIRKYRISSAPGKKQGYSQSVYLVLCAKKNYTLLGIKRDVKRGKLTLNDAAKLIFALLTTEKPKVNKSSWALRIVHLYKTRWFIDTSFSDLNRIARRWKSKYDNVRYLDVLMRMLLYNSWKIHRTILKKNRSIKHKTHLWKLVQNQELLVNTFLSSEKKSIETSRY